MQVLLVEDNDLVRKLTESQLKALGYHVISVASGAEAVARLAEHPDIGLLFTDVVMPGGMNGHQLAEEARRRRPDLPVLFTTGYAAGSIEHVGLAGRGTHVIQKPYRRDDLAAKIGEIFAGPDGH